MHAAVDAFAYPVARSAWCMLWSTAAAEYNKLPLNGMQMPER